MGTKLQSVADRGIRDDGYGDGSSRYLRRQRRLAAHFRQSFRNYRRSDVGPHAYLISNAIILPATSWIGKFIGRKRFLIICIVIFTGRVGLMRRCAEPDHPDHRPRSSGNGRRRIAADSASRSARKLSACKTRRGNGTLRNGRCRCTDHRPDARRLDHR